MRRINFSRAQAKLILEKHDNQRRVRYNKSLNLGNGKRIELSATSIGGYFTAVSRDVMKDTPIVIGPLSLNRDQFLELAEQCTEVAELMRKKIYKPKPLSRIDPELY